MTLDEELERLHAARGAYLEAMHRVQRRSEGLDPEAASTLQHDNDLDIASANGAFLAAFDGISKEASQAFLKSVFDEESVPQLMERQFEHRRVILLADPLGARLLKLLRANTAGHGLDALEKVIDVFCPLDLTRFTDSFVDLGRAQELTGEPSVRASIRAALPILEAAYKPYLRALHVLFGVEKCGGTYKAPPGNFGAIVKDFDRLGNVDRSLFLADASLLRNAPGHMNWRFDAARGVAVLWDERVSEQEYEPPRLARILTTTYAQARTFNEALYLHVALDVAAEAGLFRTLWRMAALIAANPQDVDPRELEKRQLLARPLHLFTKVSGSDEFLTRLDSLLRRDGEP